MTTSPGPPMTGPRDPELVPGGSYALDPRVVAPLVALLPSTSGETTSTSAPFTGQRLADVPTSSPDDVAAAVASARVAQRAWGALALAERAQVLLDLHDLVLDRRHEAMDLIQWENGKARKHAFEEVAHVAMTARYYGLTARRHLGRDRRSGLFPGLTVRENLLLGEKPGVRDTRWTMDDMFGLFPRLRERADVFAGVLSGGEQQMLTICRTLMGNPELMMIDEPTEGLSPQMTGAVASLLQEIARRGVAILLIEQKLAIALGISARLYVMGHGRVVFEGSPADLEGNAAVRKEWLEV